MRTHSLSSRRVWIAALVLLAAAAGPAAARAAAGDGVLVPALQTARVHRTGAGPALSLPSRAAPAAVVARFLRALGATDATVASLQTVATTQGAGGLTHVRLQQWVGGLRVHDTYAKAALDTQGRLVHLVENVAPVSGVRSARVDERAASAAAVAAVRPGGADVRVERVVIPTRTGRLRAGFLVETWGRTSNLLHETLVDGDGAVVEVVLRTARDSYNVFTEHPNATPQGVQAGPGTGNAESPVGWLAGSQRSRAITGNNARAYLDADANNVPDPGGAAIADGNFLAAADFNAQPTAGLNPDVAVQNLFWLNNLIHDQLYAAGFTETTGNFQADNFGEGGRGGDPVQAEAQDDSGTDNANFSTPRDGRSPRMQMFLWSRTGTHEVEVTTPLTIAGTYLANGAEFGPGLNTTGITAPFVLADDGTGVTSDGCEPLVGSATGRTVVVDRGTCTFVVKVSNAQAAGAVAVIVANNQGGTTIFTMGGDDPSVPIPSVMVSQNDGATIKSGLDLGAAGTVRLADPQPIMIDGDLDADIVYHEYGHGLTWRMIGGMSGAISGAIGEGMSDVLALIYNGDDVVGEYSFDSPAGIRRDPYTNYPRTYSSVDGGEVHNDGEIYGAIGWRLIELYTALGIPRSQLLADLVDGMNFTPSRPAFEDMRDGVLASVAGTSRECVVWDAFADFGVGVGAKGRVKGTKVAITESFAKPPACGP